MEQNVIVYSTGPACVKCRATKRVLEKQGTPYDEVNISENEDARRLVIALAEEHNLQMVAPVVVVRDEFGTVVQVWSDHRENRLRNLV